MSIDISDSSVPFRGRRKLIYVALMNYLRDEKLGDGEVTESELIDYIGMRLMPIEVKLGIRYFDSINAIEPCGVSDDGELVYREVESKTIRKRNSIELSQCID